MNEDSTQKNPASFVVTKDGFLYAADTFIKGTIEADELIANNKGEIAGWTISSKALSSTYEDTKNNKTYNLKLSSKDKNMIYAGQPSSTGEYNYSSNLSTNTSIGQVFLVTNEGKMMATEATIRGTLYSEAGKIGGWTLGATRLTGGSGNHTVGLDSSQITKYVSSDGFDPKTDGVKYFAIWAGATNPGSSYTSKPEDDKLENRIKEGADFVVTKDGFLQAKNAYINGNITAEVLTANDSG
ncbi:MAG: hypothetical protein NC548_25655 [Lachnospiraceae bacterium]|nr:hypothetical protein [Lachnospiraceae bacterium]